MPRKLCDRELTELIEEMTNLGNTVDGRIEQTIDVLRTLKMCIRDRIFPLCCRTAT